MGGFMEQMKVDLRKILLAIRQTEESIAKLYIHMSQMTDKNLSKFFSTLASEEYNQKQLYIELLEEINQNQSLYPISVEDAEFLDQMINIDLFENPIVKEHLLKENALLLAEKIEKDGIILYTELKRIFPNLCSNTLDNIIAEEKKHLKAITDLQFKETLEM